MSRPEPCPFCGKAPTHTGTGLYLCEPCSGTLSSIYGWNSRPIEDALRVDVDSLEQQIDHGRTQFDAVVMERDQLTHDLAALQTRLSESEGEVKRLEKVEQWSEKASNVLFIGEIRTLREQNRVMLEALSRARETLRLWVDDNHPTCRAIDAAQAKPPAPAPTDDPLSDEAKAFVFEREFAILPSMMVRALQERFDIPEDRAEKLMAAVRETQGGGG